MVLCSCPGSSKPQLPCKFSRFRYQVQSRLGLKIHGRCLVVAPMPQAVCSSRQHHAVGLLLCPLSLVSIMSFLCPTLPAAAQMECISSGPDIFTLPPYFSHPGRFEHGGSFFGMIESICLHLLDIFFFSVLNGVHYFHPSLTIVSKARHLAFLSYPTTFLGFSANLTRSLGFSWLFVERLKTFFPVFFLPFFRFSSFAPVAPLGPRLSKHGFLRRCADSTFNIGTVSYDMACVRGV